jgi:HNH endonuclease
MTHDVVARGLAALKGVTEGLWWPKAIQGSPEYQPHYGVESETRTIVYATSDWEGYGSGSSKADAEFIAWCRTGVPELIAEVQRLKRSLDNLGLPRGYIIKHINGDLHDNNLQNLRLVKIPEGDE